MRILVDENIPLVSVQALRIQGPHDVTDVRGTAESGCHDDQLWEKAQREGRVLVTTDKGFAEHRGDPHHGILIVRLRQPNEQRIHARIMQAFQQFQRESDWPGMLVVMRDHVQSVSRNP